VNAWYLFKISTVEDNPGKIVEERRSSDAGAWGFDDCATLAQHVHTIAGSIGNLSVNINGHKASKRLLWVEFVFGAHASVNFH
jgi:hypothetical protein